MVKKDAYVTEVIDGDTFRSGQAYVRLARVDAPEKGTPNSRKATEHLRGLIEKSTVKYEQVGTSYGRIVAEVWKGEANINDKMIAYINRL